MCKSHLWGPWTFKYCSSIVIICKSSWSSCDLKRAMSASIVIFLSRIVNSNLKKDLSFVWVYTVNLGDELVVCYNTSRCFYFMSVEQVMTKSLLNFCMLYIVKAIYQHILVQYNHFFVQEWFFFYHIHCYVSQTLFHM